MVYFDFEPEERFRHTWTPIIDVYERGSEIILRVELPGVEKSDIRLRWKDGVLTIAGMKRRPTSQETSCRYICVERQYGRFRRDIAISVAIDFRNSVAEFQNGLLQVRLPKLPEHAGDTDIPIK